MNKVIVFSGIGAIILIMVIAAVMIFRKPEPSSLPPSPSPSPSPSPLRDSEVFAVGPYAYKRENAEQTCKQYNNATLATDAQLLAAYKAGAEWCSTGWLKDTKNNTIAGQYPMQKRDVEIKGCGDKAGGIMFYSPDDNLAGVNCYGRKPDKDTKNILPFNAATKQWYAK